MVALMADTNGSTSFLEALHCSMSMHHFLLWYLPRLDLQEGTPSTEFRRDILHSRRSI